MKTVFLPYWIIIPFSVLVLCQGCLLHQSNKEAGLRTVVALEKNRIPGVHTQSVQLSFVGQESDFKEWCGSPLDILDDAAQRKSL